MMKKRAMSIVISVAVIVAGLGVYQFKQAQDLRTHIINQYARAFHNLVNYVNNVDVSLTKGILASEPRHMVAVAAEINRDAGFALASLAQLPLSNSDIEGATKFLSQVGDYTFSLSEKMQNGESVTDEERQSLKDMGDYARNLKDVLVTMQNELYSQRINLRSFDNMTQAEVDEGSENRAQAAGVGEIQEKFQDYPTLIYDGPFSDHLTKQDALFIKDEPEISEEEARQKALEFLGEDRIAEIRFEELTQGDIPTFNFLAVPEGVNAGEQDITINITQKRGFVLCMLQHKEVPDETVTVDEAVQIAADFLAEKGIDSMKYTYYMRADGFVVVNFAYSQDGVVVYPDLIKVKVSLDNGEIAGFESRGYVINHRPQRAVPQNKMSPDEARGKVTDILDVKLITEVIIPKNSGREYYCYELKGNIDDTVFLVYINAVTGVQENILILQETEEGVLTI